MSEWIKKDGYDTRILAGGPELSAPGVEIQLIQSGELQIDDESTEARWITPAAALSLPLARSQKRRIVDVAEYLDDGCVRLK